jgi:hypothetical protein
MQVSNPKTDSVMSMALLSNENLFGLPYHGYELKKMPS